MAERRMFSKTVINSARFLRMPQTTRLLYYDLGMAADDDGLVEAFTVLRTTGAAEDDLRVLAAKGFVTILNEDLVSFITDWKKNNLIRPDRYRPSEYAELLVRVENGEISERYTNGIPTVNQRETQVSIGKDSIGKDSIKADKPSSRKYGEYGWVKLTDLQYQKLLQELGQAELDRCIRYVDESAQSTRNKNKWADWNLVIRKCHRNGWGLRQGAQTESRPDYSWRNQGRG